MIRRFLLTAVVAAAVPLFGPSASQAAFKIKIERLDVSTGASLGFLDLSTDPGQQDEGLDRVAAPPTNTSSVDINPAANRIGISATNAFLAGLNLDISSVTSTGPVNSFLQSVQASVENNSGTEVRLRVYATNVFDIPPQGGNPLTISGSTVFEEALTSGLSFGTTGGLWVYADADGVEFAQDTLITNLVPTEDSQLYSNQFVRNATPYSVTLIMDYTVAAGGMVSGLTASAAISPAPAPSGLILAAGAVPFMGLFRRWRKSATGIAA